MHRFYFKKGVSAPEIQSMLGHSTLSMTQHYLKNIVPMNTTVEKVQKALG